jgi:hypothetical protein
VNVVWSASAPGGSESLYPAEPYAPAFAMARDGGLAAVPHAGELGDPDAVRLLLQPVTCGSCAGRMLGAVILPEQVPAQEVEFGGHHRLVLVEEGGVVPAVDLNDLACGGPAGGLQRRCR